LDNIAETSAATADATEVLPSAEADNGSSFLSMEQLDAYWERTNAKTEIAVHRASLERMLAKRRWLLREKYAAGSFAI
jgi:hypothetical protein